MNDIQAINTNIERTKREVPKDLPSLSVFQYPYRWNTWYGFWHNLAYFFRCRRPAWQRATKGYCRMDTWNVDYTLTAYLIKVLTEYRNVTNGWPDQYFAAFEEWIAAIDQCIDWLIFSAEDPDKLNKHYTEYQEFAPKGPKNWTEYECDVFEDYVAEVNRIYDMQCEARKKAFAFLGEYLPHIWW